MPTDKITLIVFDDHPDLRQGMEWLFADHPEIHLAGTFPNCEKLTKIVDQVEPHVIFMDIDMPGINGIDAVRIIKTHHPEIHVLMLTVFDDEDKIFLALRNGASGYLLKSSSPEEIISAVTSVQSGGVPLTANIAQKILTYFKAPLNPDYLLTNREIEILRELMKGNSYKRIGVELDISMDTVRAHIRNIYAKLQVHTKSEAVAKAIKDKLL
ncbi:MAG: response regulator transcription factor [Bacteroidia bacterium]